MKDGGLIATEFDHQLSLTIIRSHQLYLPHIFMKVDERKKLSFLSSS